MWILDFSDKNAYPRIIHRREVQNNSTSHQNIFKVNAPEIMGYAKICQLVKKTYCRYNLTANCFFSIVLLNMKRIWHIFTPNTPPQQDTTVLMG